MVHDAYPLLEYCKTGNLKEAKKLLKNKDLELNINKVDDENGETPLSYAIGILGKKKKLDLEDEFDTYEKWRANGLEMIEAEEVVQLLLNKKAIRDVETKNIN